MANTSHVGTPASSTHAVHEEGEMDLVATWLVFDLPRTIAGAMAGVFAGLVAWVFAGTLAMLGGLEFWYPFKLPAVTILGGDAMRFGLTLAIVVGTLIHCTISAVLGMVYAHFVKSNHLAPLLGAGFVWGTFSWVFINNLFVRSFQAVREVDPSRGAAFFVLLVFGFSLASLRIFDRIVCGRARD